MAPMNDVAYSVKLRATNEQICRKWMTDVALACSPKHLQLSMAGSEMELEGVNGKPVVHCSEEEQDDSEGGALGSLSSSSTVQEDVVDIDGNGEDGGTPNLTLRQQVESLLPPFEYKRTDEELEGMENLKFQLGKEYNPAVVSDQMLIRFLRARDFDIDKAHAMLTSYLHWREEARPHEITKDEVLNYVRQRVCLLHKYDRDGHPCIVIFAANHNPNERTIPGMLKYILYVVETACQVMRRSETEEKFAIIFDYENFSKGKNGDWDITKEAINVLQNYYPERLAYVCLINYPWALGAIWQVVKPCLDPNTAKKVKFVSEMKKLLDLFEPDNLLEQYGGTSKLETPSDDFGEESCLQVLQKEAEARSQ